MIEITECPSDATIQLVANVNGYTSTLNGFQQFSELPGSRWSLSVTWINKQGRSAQVLRSQLTSLMGQLGTFKLRVPGQRRAGTALGNPVVSSATPGSRTILSSGWTPNQPIALSAGDWIEVGGHVFMVSADVSAGADGAASIPVTPAIRKTTPAGTAIISDNPKFTLRLLDAAGGDMALSAGGYNAVHNFGIDAIEVD